MGTFLEARDFLLARREDYATAYRDFQWPELEHFNWALDYFDAALVSDRPALRIMDDAGAVTTLTFAELSRESNRVANFLRRLGARRGDRLLLMLPNVPELWVTMLAAMKLGVVVIPATMLLTLDDLRDRFERGGVRLVVTDGSATDRFNLLHGDYTRVTTGSVALNWNSFDDAQSESEVFVPDGVTRGEDPLLLYFTSGTTARPKLVLHTHRSYPAGHLSTMYWVGIQSDDLHFNISSPGWAKHAWSSFFAPWNAGACIFVYNYARFDPVRLLDAIAAHKVTTLCAPPTVWRMLINVDLAAWKVSLRELASAGEPLNPEVIERVREAWGLTIRDGYGQTETTAQIGNPPGQLLKSGSMGRPLPGYRTALVNADGEEAEEGEISLPLRERPLGLMAGYADDATVTAHAMRDGYYHTGDVAQRDRDGYITYVGRADDVFKSSDYRISPFEIESILIEHPAVAEAAVVPSPDALRLCVPKGFLSLRAGFEPTSELAADIFRFSRERLAAYKRVRRIEFSELPKTISGKIRRVDLRNLEIERAEANARGEREHREEDFVRLASP